MNNNPNNAQGLGSIVEEYVMDTARARGQWPSMVLLILAGLAGVGVGIFGYFSGEDPDIIIVAILGAIPLFLGLRWLQGSQSSRNWKIVVFEKGIAYHQHGQSGQFRWTEIAAVYQNIRKTHKGTLTAIFKIILDNDTKLQFDQTYKDIRKLGTMVQQQVATHRYQEFWDAYQNGATLPFNLLKLSKAGLTARDNLLPWDEVDTVDFHYHIATVHKKGRKIRWEQVNITLLPNVLLLTRLLSEILGHTIDNSKLY
ncbi:MAG: DUF6585 family protein [Candidatus Promineifilaceae bacterium]